MTNLIAVFLLFAFANCEDLKAENVDKVEEEEPFLSTLDLIVLGLAGTHYIRHIIS